MNSYIYLLFFLFYFNLEIVEKHKIRIHLGIVFSVRRYSLLLLFTVFLYHHSSMCFFSFYFMQLSCSFFLFPHIFATFSSPHLAQCSCASSLLCSYYFLYLQCVFYFYFTHVFPFCYTCTGKVII